MANTSAKMSDLTNLAFERQEIYVKLANDSTPFHVYIFIRQHMHKLSESGSH
jgi:hypothetical protein